VEDSSASQRQHQPDENPQVQGDGMGVDGPQFVEQQHAEQQQQQQQEQEQMTAEQYQSYWQAYYTQQAAVAGADASAQQYDADYYNSEEYRQYYAQWYAAQQAAAAASNGPQVQQMGGVPEEGSHLQQAWVAESQQQQDGLVGRESLQQQQQQQQHDQQQLLTHESLQQQQQQQPCLPAIQTQQHQPWVLGQQPEQPLPHRSSLVQAEQPLQHQYLQEIQPEQLLPHHSSQAQQEQPLQQLQSPQAQEHELPLHTNVSQAQPEQPLQHHFPQLSQAAHTQQPLHQHPSQPSTEQLMLQQRLSQSSEAAQAQQLPHQYSQLSEAAQAQQLPHQYSQLSEAAQAQQLPHQYSQIQPAHNLASAFGGGEAAADEAGDVSGFFSVGVPDAPSGGAPSAFSVHNRLALMQASSGVSFFQQEDEKEEEEEQRRQQQQQQQQQQQEKVAQVSPPSPLSMEAPPHSQHPSLQPSLQDPHPQESKPGQAHDDPAAQEEEPHANGVTDVTAAAGACVGTEATMQANKQQQQQQQEQEQRRSGHENGLLDNETHAQLRGGGKDGLEEGVAGGIETGSSQLNGESKVHLQWEEGEDIAVAEWKDVKAKEEEEYKEEEELEPVLVESEEGDEHAGVKDGSTEEGVGRLGVRKQQEEGREAYDQISEARQKQEGGVKRGQGAGVAEENGIDVAAGATENDLGEHSQEGEKQIGSTEPWDGPERAEEDEEGESGTGGSLGKGGEGLAVTKDRDVPAWAKDGEKRYSNNTVVGGPKGLGLSKGGVVGAKKNGGQGSDDDEQLQQLMQALKHEAEENDVVRGEAAKRRGKQHVKSNVEKGKDAFLFRGVGARSANSSTGTDQH